jgi:serine protease
MRARLLGLAFAGFFLSLVVGSTATVRAEPGKAPKHEAVPGELIVGFRPGVSESERDRALDKAGVKAKKKLARIAAKVATTDPANVDRAIKELEADSRVRYAEPNFVVRAQRVPNDPSFGQLWGLNNTGQTVNGVAGTADADIDAPEAWDVTTGSSNVTVAVIDTGVDFSHPDLGGSMATSTLMWANSGENCGSTDPAISCAQRSNGVDDDADGYVDDWRGWDFVNRDNNPQDDNDHGSHVSGTIGGIGDNGVGVAGVNWRVKVMALKFLDSTGSGSTADATDAVLYAAAHGAQVLSNSWGGGGYSQALRDAIAQADTKGALFVAAAGNDSSDTDATPSYPASYDVPNVVAVAATTQSDGLASFSNVGKSSVDLGAPGTNVYSTIPGGRYAYFNGTSMATPHVSGTAALAKAAFPDATGVGLKALLMGTVDPAGAASGTWSRTNGRVNASKAVHCADVPELEIERPVDGFLASTGDGLSIAAIATRCASPGGVTVSASVNGASVPLVGRGDGLYTAVYNATAAGPATLSVTASVGSASVSRSVSGTVAENYGMQDAPYAWIDATVGGTNIGVSGDDVDRAIALPFPFTFYKRQYTSARVGSNGLLTLNGNSAASYDNAPIPDGGVPNTVIAPFWDDLYVTSTGSVWTKVVGTSPNRKLVTEWAKVGHFAISGDVTFEAILDEATGDITFQYKDVVFDTGAYDDGGSASIGIENEDGSVGRQLSYNVPTLDSYVGAKAIRFFFGPPDTTAPVAPTGLLATAGQASLALDWDDNSEPDLGGYRVYRQNLDGSWTLVGSPAASAFTDTGLAAGTAYTYEVTAVDRSGNESAPSATASATPTADATRPALPTGLSASAGDGSVALDWADNTESDLAHYNVYRDGVVVGSPTASAYVDAGLTNGTSYTYAVTAVDASGNESDPSTSVSATPSRAPITESDRPTAVGVLAGRVTVGNVTRLYANDGSRLEVTAALQAGVYAADYYASTGISPTAQATLRTLRIDYDGNSSSTATMTLSVYDWLAGAWQTVNGPLGVGSHDRAVTWSTSTPLAYVSSSGEVRFRVRATRGGGFKTRTDLVGFTVTY